MLGGIVAMQVSLLRLNTGISRAVQTQETLVRQNATLQAAIAESTSGEKIAGGRDVAEHGRAARGRDALPDGAAG